MNLLKRVHLLDGVGLLIRPFDCALIMPKADCTLRDLMSHRDKVSLISAEDLGCLASVVAHLHENQIIHGDLEPENILTKQSRTGMKIFLSDFGSSLCCFANETLSESKKGMTPRYAAPETHADQVCNYAPDIWSLGCIFMEIMTLLYQQSGRSIPKFANMDSRLPYHSASREIYVWLYACSTSGESPITSTQIYLIRRMLDVNTSVRPSAFEVSRGFLSRECCGRLQDYTGQRASDNPEVMTGLYPYGQFPSQSSTSTSNQTPQRTAISIRDMISSKSLMSSGKTSEGPDHLRVASQRYNSLGPDFGDFPKLYEPLDESKH